MQFETGTLVEIQKGKFRFLYARVLASRRQYSIFYNKALYLYTVEISGTPYSDQLFWETELRFVQAPPSPPRTILKYRLSLDLHEPPGGF